MVSVDGAAGGWQRRFRRLATALMRVVDGLTAAGDDLATMRQRNSDES